MRELDDQINSFNTSHLKRHREKVEIVKNLLELDDSRFESIIRKICDFQVAIPSWALGTGGTRFGRFPAGGEPRTLAEKIEDVALIHKLTASSDSISLHIPWDIPKDMQATREQLRVAGLTIDAVNSNTFQDQPDQIASYKFGSLCHTAKDVRVQAVNHNIEVIQYGVALGSRVLSVWLADGSNFPGQQHFRKAYQHSMESLQEIYRAMPSDWTMLVEYKPFEPNFYSMVIPDWGTALRLTESCGERAHVLVDLGHHLPNTNIEQIVARLMHFGRLGGFHFNGSHYGDDDLTTGSIKPYQLFLIFNELVAGANDSSIKNPPVAYMIDASHNTKDPIEDLIQSLGNIRKAYAKALLVDDRSLLEAQMNNKVTAAEQLLQQAFQADVRPLIAEARIRSKACLDPAAFFSELNIRDALIRRRGRTALATGL